MSDHLRQMLDRFDDRRKSDAEAYAGHDPDLCMLCHASGEDKRSLLLSCGYDVKEAVPEALDMGRDGGGFYLLICKTCRGHLLQHMQQWRNEAVSRRGLPKDSDGGLLDAPYEAIAGDRNIPIRRFGRIDYITEAEWRARQT